MRRPTRRETLLGGLVLSAAAAGLWPEAERPTREAAFRMLVAAYVPPEGVESWKEIAESFLATDGEAATICARLAPVAGWGTRVPMACLNRLSEDGAVADLRRRAIAFFVFGTDLLSADRPPGTPVRFVAVPDPMSGQFCNPVARFDEGPERA